MPAQSVDPCVDEQRKHKTVEGASHDHAGEECEGELKLAHRDPAGLTARTYPLGGTGVGVDRTSAPSCGKRAGGESRFLICRSGHALNLSTGSIPEDPSSQDVASETIGE